MIGIVTAVRWTLTAALLVGVYTETGPWTTLLLVLIAVGHESVAAILRSLQS